MKASFEEACRGYTEASEEAAVRHSRRPSREAFLIATLEVQGLARNN
jgi:hypothetical protein